MAESNNKKKLYALRDMSYMSLSIGYIGLLIALAVGGLLSFGYYILNGRVILAVLIALLVTGACYFIIHTGTKYGTYGLEILLGKFLQKKQLKNDFPIIQQQLLHRPDLIHNSILKE